MASARHLTEAECNLLGIPKRCRGEAGREGVLTEETYAASTNTKLGRWSQKKGIGKWQCSRHNSGGWAVRGRQLLSDGQTPPRVRVVRNRGSCRCFACGAIVRAVSRKSSCGASLHYRLRGHDPVVRLVLNACDHVGEVALAHQVQIAGVDARVLGCHQHGGSLRLAATGFVWRKHEHVGDLFGGRVKGQGWRGGGSRFSLSTLSEAARCLYGLARNLGKTCTQL